MFNFGTNNAAAAAKPATVTGTTGFSFGATTTPAATTTTTTAASSGFSFGNKTATTTAAAAVAPLSFGAKTTTTATTTTTASTGSLFGNTSTTTTTAAAPTGGLFGAAATTTATPATLTAPTTTKPGLGGSGFTPGQTDASKAETQTKQPIKQQVLPKEIKDLVGNLEQFIKKEKDESNKVAKYSQRELTKIKENASSLEIVIKSLKSSLQREGGAVKKLSERAVELHTGVAMAQRTNDTHAALQHENIAPSRYFGELIKEFETTLTVYRAQIDNLESHLAAGNESIINQLPNSLERLHQTFIALAANLQIILGQLDKMKQRYLAYRRHQGDTTDVFARKKPIEKALVGPSPFAELSNLNVLALAQIQSQQQAQQQPQATAGQATTGGNSTTTTGGLFGNTTSANTGGGLFGNSTATTGGLFGNASKPAATTGGGLFGNTATAKPASTFSFGNTSTTAATTTQSGSLFGNSSGFSFGAKK